MRNKGIVIGLGKSRQCHAYRAVGFRGMKLKTYSESRIELRNLQTLKKMLENSSQFSSSDQPCKLNSSDAALNIEGVEKKNARKTCSCGQHWRPFDSGFECREEG